MVHHTDDGFVAVVIKFSSDVSSTVTRICSAVESTVRNTLLVQQITQLYHNDGHEMIFCIKLTQGAAVSEQNAKDICGTAMAQIHAVKCLVQYPGRHIMRAFRTYGNSEYCLPLLQDSDSTFMKTVFPAVWSYWNARSTSSVWLCDNKSSSFVLSVVFNKTPTGTTGAWINEVAWYVQFATLRLSLESRWLRLEFHIWPWTALLYWILEGMVLSMTSIYWMICLSADDYRSQQHKLLIWASVQGHVPIAEMFLISPGPAWYYSFQKTGILPKVVIGVSWLCCNNFQAELDL